MIIKNISRTENMVIPDSRLEKIASICKGDLRYAINIIQREPLNLKNMDIEIRNEVFNIDITIKKLLGKNENKKKILYETSATLDEIYKNLSEVTAKSDLDLFTRNSIFHRISRIDVFMSRIRKKRIWRLFRQLRYMILDVSIKLTDHDGQYFKEIPDYPLSRYIYGSKRERIQKVAEKLGKELHMSQKKVITDVLPFLTLQKDNYQTEFLDNDILDILKELKKSENNF